MKIDELGQTGVINGKGMLVAHSDLAYSESAYEQYRQTVSEEAITQVLKDYNGIVEVSVAGSNPSNELLFFQTLNDPVNWKILIHIPKREFYLEIIEITVIAWSLLLVCIVIVTILLIRASKRITEPLEKTVLEMNRLTIKNLDLSLLSSQPNQYYADTTQLFLALLLQKYA